MSNLKCSLHIISRISVHASLYHHDSISRWSLAREAETRGIGVARHPGKGNEALCLERNCDILLSKALARADTEGLGRLQLVVAVVVDPALGLELKRILEVVGRTAGREGVSRDPCLPRMVRRQPAASVASEKDEEKAHSAHSCRKKVTIDRISSSGHDT